MVLFFYSKRIIKHETKKNKKQLKVGDTIICKKVRLDCNFKINKAYKIIKLIKNTYGHSVRVCDGLHLGFDGLVGFRINADTNLKDYNNYNNLEDYFYSKKELLNMKLKKIKTQ